MAEKRKFRRLAAASPFRREPFGLVVHLFHEGGTEIQYLQDLCAGTNVHVLSVKRNANPQSLIDEAVRHLNENAGEFRRNLRREVWIVFDDDEKPAIPAVLKAFPSALRQVKDATLRSRIHVAFMKPCIELWGVLCLKDGVRLYAKAPGHRKMESLLRKHMPSYRHDGHPYFDIDKMPEWKSACEQARQWEATWGTFPNCGSATWFAGIHELVRRIQDAK